MKALPTGAISCKLCASSFHLSGAERVQYAAKGWEAPKACPTCRKLRRLEPPICDDFRGVCRRQSCRFRHIPHDISLPMTQPSKSNLSVQSSPFSGPSLRKPKATPGIVECVTPISILLSVGKGRELECPISLVDIPDAACLKPGSLVLVTLTTSTNQPSRIFIAPQLMLSYPLSEALSWRPIFLTARSLFA